MKANLLLSLSFTFVTAAACFSQSSCFTASGAVRTDRLVCQFPASGSTLATLTFGPNAPAVKQALIAAVPINAAIAAQLTQLPVPSATVGAIRIRKKAGETAERWDNLGPILTDRPDTVGKAHVFAGFNYQHFTFNSLDGFHLGTLPVAFTYSEPGTEHFGSMSNNVDFKLDQYVFVVTAGVTPLTDVSIVLPINSVSMKVYSHSFQAYDFDILTNSYSVHTIGSGTTATSKGSATGIGDLTIGIKQMVLGQNQLRPAAAVGATLRFPTGDEFNYLGSGAVGGSVFGLFEYRARFAPHGKLAYQWNGESSVLDLVGGGTAPLPGGLQYSVGADFSANRRVTLNVDFLGSQFVNSPYFTRTTTPFNPPPSPTSGVPATFDVISTPAHTYTTANFSGGVKWTPVSHLVVYGNALVQLNNVGLKSDVSPLFGIAYNFSLSKGD